MARKTEEQYSKGEGEVGHGGNGGGKGGGVFKVEEADEDNAKSEGGVPNDADAVEEAELAEVQEPYGGRDQSGGDQSEKNIIEGKHVR